MAVCAVLAVVFPKHLAEIFVFGGVGIFLALCLLGAAIGVHAGHAFRQ